MVFVLLPPLAIKIASGFSAPACRPQDQRGHYGHLHFRASHGLEQLPQSGWGVEKPVPKQPNR